MNSKKPKDVWVDLEEAKARLADLAELTWRGVDVVLTRDGQPYVELRPRTVLAPRKPGRYRDAIEIADNFDVANGKRDLFEELMDGIDEMRVQREGTMSVKDEEQGDKSG